MTGLDLLQYAHGIDGCGAPIFAAPLGNWARAFALFSDGKALSKTRNEACQRIRQSIAAEPLYIAGHDRACSAINGAYGETITVKTGAEIAIGAVIKALGYPVHSSLNKFFQPKLLNGAGIKVGDITVPDFAWCN